MVLQGIIQQSIKTILLNESEWFASIARNRKHFHKAFMVHVLVFILTWIIPSLILGNIVLCRWLSDKESACQCRRHRRHRFDPCIRKIPCRRNWQLIQYSCLENPGKWTEEPAGLLSMGSQRVGHSWATEHLHECYLNLGLFFFFVTFFLWHMCFGVNINGAAQKHTCWQLYFPYYASLLWVKSYDLSHESQANQIYVHGTITKLLGMLVMGPTCSVCLDS